MNWTPNDMAELDCPTPVEVLGGFTVPCGKVKRCSACAWRKILDDTDRIRINWAFTDHGYMANLDYADAGEFKGNNIPKFMRALRQILARGDNEPPLLWHYGQSELGPKKARPHHHIAIGCIGAPLVRKNSRESRELTQLFRRCWPHTEQHPNIGKGLEAFRDPQKSIEYVTGYLLDEKSQPSYMAFLKLREKFPETSFDFGRQKCSAHLGRLWHLKFIRPFDGLFAQFLGSREVIDHAQADTPMRMDEEIDGRQRWRTIWDHTLVISPQVRNLVVVGMGRAEGLQCPGNYGSILSPRRRFFWLILCPLELAKVIQPDMAIPEGSGHTVRSRCGLVRGWKWLPRSLWEDKKDTSYVMRALLTVLYPMVRYSPGLLGTGEPGSVDILHLVGRGRPELWPKIEGTSHGEGSGLGSPYTSQRGSRIRL